MYIQLRCWDSNPRHLEHESPPIISRPGLPLMKAIMFKLNLRFLLRADVRALKRRLRVIDLSLVLVQADVVQAEAVTRECRVGIRTLVA